MTTKIPDANPPYEGECTGWDLHFEHKGRVYGPPFDLETIKRCEDFVFDPSDIVLCAYPKTGNTWCEEIIYFIKNADDIEAAKKLQTESDIMARFPMLEVPQNPMGVPPGIDVLNARSPPRMMNTHLPYSLIGKQLDKAKPKIVCIIRNPRDVCVSYFHFINSIPFAHVEKWNDYFRFFINGQCTFGDYFTHTAEWWGQRKRDNIFFITYEELKKDTAAGIRRLAKYLEKELTDEQVQAIVEATSISNMKKTSCKAGPQMADAFFRKGVIGDWKNYLTDEQRTILDQQSKKYLESIGLKFKYD